MSDEERPAGEVFTVTKRGRRRVIVIAVAMVAFAFLIPLLSVHDRAVYWAYPVVTVFFVFGLLKMNRTGAPVLKLTNAGIAIPGVGKTPERLLLWNRLSEVEYRLVRSGYHSPGTPSGAWLIFYLGALKWSYRLPAGVLDGERIAEIIRKRIRPEVAAKRDTLDAATFFEVVFDIRLPETARVVHAEWHPADGTGWWAVRMSPEDFGSLRAGEGTVSGFYPVTADQKFRVGGRRLSGRSELNGDYAISPHDWNATPVLVADREESVLHGLLTDAMA